MKTRLRVLQCITRLGLGGAERVAFTLIKALRSEVDFAVFTAYGASADAVGQGMREELLASATPWYRGTRLPMKCGGMLPAGLALGRAVQDFRPDIVHFHSEIPEVCGAVFVTATPRERRPALARTIHNSVFWRYWPRIGNWCARRLQGAQVACVSNAALAEFRRYLAASGAEPPPAPPEVIYNGLELDFQPPVNSPAQRDRVRILFAGRFESQKGVDLLGAAIPLVPLPPGHFAELSFIGGGSLYPLVDGLVRHPPRGWKIEVGPPVADLRAVFSAFDLLVMPSRFEGLPLVAIEATIRGLPVIATRAAGLDEALPPDHPWWARREDPRDLARVLGDAIANPAQWSPAIDRAQEFVRQRFALAEMGRRYGACYRRVVASSPMPAN